MSLKPQPRQGVPEATARLARELYKKKGNIYLAIHDELDGIFRDEDFEELYAHEGKPGVAAWRVGLACMVQHMENLTDEQTVAQITSRIDLKYLLEMELTDIGFDKTVLSKFRQRLVACEQENRLLERLVEVLGEKGHIKGRGKQRTDSTIVLAAIRETTRIECVGEAVRQVLDRMATETPEWLQERVPQVWYDRYGRRFEINRITRDKTEKTALAETIGADGQQIIQWLAAADVPDFSDRVQAAVKMLKAIWEQQYKTDEKGILRWRNSKELAPCGQLIESPHDPEVRYGTKRGRTYLGYKTHVTETCDEDKPHLIINVITTAASEQDNVIVDMLYEQLDKADLLPGEHLLDSGYLDAAHLVSLPETYQVQLTARVREAQLPIGKGPDAFVRQDFHIDWDRQCVTCPQGHQSATWIHTAEKRRNDQYQKIVQVRFAASTCQSCPVKARCTTSTRHGRSIQFLPRIQHEALMAARQRQHTAPFKARYKLRAGVEGTISTLTGPFSMRRSRYIGQARTQLQAAVTAVGYNVCRWFDHHCEKPLARTRITPFKKLQKIA